MILYLASYPRSGNSLLQRVLRRNFDFRWIEAPQKGALRDIVWGISDGAVLEMRRSLAASGDGRAYLKTHARPFDGYLEGERVLQLVRHPGAAIWSYFRYLADTLPSDEHRYFSPPPTFEAVIAGEVGAGSWSAYQQSWAAAAAGLGERYLAMKYEDAVADQAAARNRVAAFLSVPVGSDDLVTFTGYQRRKAGWDVRGTSVGYERFYSKSQLELLWEMHGEAASKFGYAPPDFSACAPDEQVRRLREMLEAAWTHARTLEMQPWRKLRRVARRRLRRLVASLRRGRS